MEEIWKDIKGFEGLYQVSNMGRVKSLNYNRKNIQKILNPYLNKCGYYQVTFSENNHRTLHRVNRLVAQAFISNDDNKTQVNHIDEDKKNNIVSNLEWVTPKENINHGSRTERMAITQGKKIICSNGQSFNSISECSRQLNIDVSSISQVLHGSRNAAGGYTFKFKEEVTE